ncbi:Nif3-like dinuclear metal center hexameric protein [Phenylobacterium deserti]|uniref:Nif3-like dinuclear metal center hexameric protein n=1 Tax=Phenylobacterium deserti TaxID=1914756 RepID=UPI001403C442|nr:Nif3-like dinuclear metal center hexameric protein [Phenylobacterium deserti]
MSEFFLTRRQLAFAGGAASLASPVAAQGKLTVGEALAKVRQAIGASADAGAEGLLLGAADQPVRGVAVAAVPTAAVLQAAAKRGCNLIFALESPLYARPGEAGSGYPPGSGARAAAALKAEPVYRGKAALAARLGVSVVRLNESLQASRPSLAADTLAARFGWSGGETAGQGRMYAIKPAPLSALLRQASRLADRGGLRHVGAKDMMIRSVLVVPGKADVVPSVQGLQKADLLLTGDLREWEIVEYVADSAPAGRPRALIALGRTVSQQPYVDAIAEWLKPVLPGVPVTAVRNADPFWRLA